MILIQNNNDNTEGLSRVLYDSPLDIHFTFYQSIFSNRRIFFPSRSIISRNISYGRTHSP